MIEDRLETDHEEWAREQIAAAGGLMQKIGFPGRRGAPDDIIFWPRGRIDLAEFKRSDGIVSHNQNEIHKSLLMLGTHVWLLYTREETARYIAVRTRYRA